MLFTDDEELIFNLEEDHHHELSTSMTNLSPNSISSGGIRHQTSLPNNKYRKQNATTTGMTAVNAPTATTMNTKFKFPRPVSGDFLGLVDKLIDLVN